MKKYTILILIMSLTASLSAQEIPANYDEAKVPVYILPDPLIFNNGTRVHDKEDWSKRRSEILTIFKNEVYGISPEWKGTIVSAEISEDRNAINGSAIRKEIRLTLKNGDKELDMMVLTYLPHSAKPVPVFVGYNFGGNHTVTEDPVVTITSSWMRNNSINGVTENKASEDGRGKAASRWPVNEIISRGYGLITIYYGDVDPDFDDGFKNGVHALYNQETGKSSWGSISAWAWGLSRVMDWIETVEAIDKNKVSVIGHSRLGKTSLWAGATDERFAIVISNNSGCGGAALFNRKFGETASFINTAFTHWFCDNFNNYNNREEDLPVDQHELLALIAPRPVYVASAEDDKWADPKGEYLSCLNASPVYQLLGLEGFPSVNMPDVNSPVKGTIGYHVRTGGHDVKLYDWQQYLDFADQHFKSK